MIINKVGIDLHGVIDSNIDLFKMLLENFYYLNVEVHIISGPPVVDIKQELNEYGLKEDLHYKFIYSVVDYLKSKNIPMWLGKEGTWWAGDEYWWGAKAEICYYKNIDIMLDDSKRYKPDFEKIKTKFILYNNIFKSKSERLVNEDVR